RMQFGPVDEPERAQRIVQGIAGVLVFAMFVLPGLDHRFGWSSVPIQAVLVADVAVAIGFWIMVRVFQENSYASSTVTVEAEQKLISTGPYGLVRHPMYAGAVLAFGATPLALGSLWTLALAVGLCGALVVRLKNEERFLSTRLPGYRAYC